MNGVDWLAARIMAASNAQQDNPGPRFNPRPPGVILAGSATEAVYAFLQLHAGVFFSRDQIIAGTARTDKAVDWALLFLRTQGRIVVHKAVPPANTRYLRYAFPKLATAAALQVGPHEAR